jgi:hypothetical protein
LARASPQVACTCLCRAHTCTRTTRASPQASTHGRGCLSRHGRAPKLRARLRLCVFVPCRARARTCMCTRTTRASPQASKHGCGCQVGTGEPPSCVHDCRVFVSCTCTRDMHTHDTSEPPSKQAWVRDKSAWASPQVACACLCRARVTCTRTTRASPQASKHGCGCPSRHGRAPKLRARVCVVHA